MNIPLSATQRTVIAIVSQAPTPAVAAGQIQSSPNLVSALKQLTNLGIFTNVSNPELTDVGSEAGQSEGVLDSAGGLTQYGQELLSRLQESALPLLSTLVKMS